MSRRLWGNRRAFGSLLVLRSFNYWSARAAEAARAAAEAMRAASAAEALSVAELDAEEAAAHGRKAQGKERGKGRAVEVAAVLNYK